MKKHISLWWVVDGASRGSIYVSGMTREKLFTFNREVELGKLDKSLLMPFQPTCAPDLNGLVQQGLLQDCKKLHVDDFKVFQRGFPDFTAVVHFCISDQEWIIHTCQGSVKLKSALITEFKTLIQPELAFQPKGFLLTTYSRIVLNPASRPEHAELKFNRDENHFYIINSTGTHKYSAGVNIMLRDDKKAVLV